MRAIIHPNRIDILGCQGLAKDAWEPLLNELKAEHVPEATPEGKRMAVFGRPNGTTDAFIYRTSDQSEPEIEQILAKYGISVEKKKSAG